MRLKPEELQIIISFFNDHINTPFELYLHGSRAFDDQKGGDIDLLLQVPADNLALIKSQQWKLTANLSQLLRSQKIDLVILQKGTDDAFFASVHKIRLN